MYEIKNRDVSYNSRNQKLLCFLGNLQKDLVYVGTVWEITTSIFMCFSQTLFTMVGDIFSRPGSSAAEIEAHFCLHSLCMCY